MTLLRLTGVSRRFGGVVAVDDVDLAVEAGEIVGRLGELQGKWDKFHAGPGRWARYGKKKPDDFRSLQVAGAKRGCAISHAGTGSHVTCAILEKE